jgi:hypothetical protein
MLELHIREILGDLVGRVHVAEGRCEDDVAAGAGEALDGALGIGAFRHAFQISGFDLVAELFFSNKGGPDRADRTSRNRRSVRHR